MTNFDPERALQEGAVTEDGLDVEILSIDADSSFPVVGLVRRPIGDQVARQWGEDGVFGGCESFNLKNKPRRVVDPHYITPKPKCFGAFVTIHKYPETTHRLDITLEDGVPVDAQIVDLREE